ncbi:MAG: hypothetical protein HGA51_01855 [Demequinaceae bacterium]|nr:hypothetical protein [Demequinaceae bacterium]
MSAILRVTGEDVRHLSSQLNALADDLHGDPFRNMDSMPDCGSSLVATAGAGANDHFALRALLIETELRDLGAMAWRVNEVMGQQDLGLAAGGGGGGGSW